MRIRTLTLTAASGAALLAAGLLPASASGAPRPVPAPEGSVSAARLLARVASCTRISQGAYRTDAGAAAATVPVCGTPDAVFWKADMDIDCDGQRTAKCNENTDPYFLPDTAFRQSDGRALRSDTLPYIVVPGPSGVWDHTASGIRGGSVAAVVYGDRVLYAVVGDTGPRGII
ncbi:secreted protein, partial [Streptomyces zinciresistens K42]